LAIPIFETKISGKPIAIVKSGDRQLNFVKVNKFNSKYFATVDGVYELDDTYEYRFKKTGIYFYNFGNSKPLSLSGMQEIDEKLKSVGEVELQNRDKFLSQVSENPEVDPTQFDIPPDRTSEMSANTKRFVEDYQTDDEFSKTNMLVHLHHQGKPILKYSSKAIGIGMNRGHFAFVQIGHKQLDVCQMYLHNDRAYTEYGVFEVSRDNIYLFKKQIICFFVLSDSENELAIKQPKKATKIMKKMIKKKAWENLESFYKPFPKNLPSKGLKLNHEPDKKNRQNWISSEPSNLPKNVSLSAEKSLVQYVADSPSIFHTTLKEIHTSKQQVAQNLSDPIKKAIPIMVIFGAVMGFAMFMSNLPAVIDEIGDQMNPNPDFIYLDKETAIAQGFYVDENTMNFDQLSKEPPPAEMVVGENEEIIINDNPLNEYQTSGENGEEMYVPDVTPPVITVPENITEESTTKGGMKIKYEASALDDVDGVVGVSCDSPSGKIFPIGTTVVTCTSQDLSGNVAEKSFTITIIGEELGGSIIPPIPSFP